MLRRVVGFDTFTGLAGLSDKDGASPEVRAGAMAVTRCRQVHLKRIAPGRATPDRATATGCSISLTVSERAWITIQLSSFVNI
jgi:hypothetical protein